MSVSRPAGPWFWFDFQGGCLGPHRIDDLPQRDRQTARDALRFVSEMLQAGTAEEVVQQGLLSDQLLVPRALG